MTTAAWSCPACRTTGAGCIEEKGILRCAGSRNGTPRGYEHVRETLGGDNIYRRLAEVQKPKPQGTQAVIERASTIEERPVAWLWQNRIELGALNLLASDPGAGKSLLTAALATAVSRGAAWPDCPYDLGRLAANVIFVTSEDDPSKSTVPRLRVAGADLARIVIIRSVEERGRQRQLSLQRDLAAIEQALATVGEVALVVIDPLDSYLGRGDSNANEEMRAVLEPLVGIAERHNVAFLAVKHLNKSIQTPNALYRIAGTMAFVALPRTVAIIGRDPDDSDRKLLMPLKVSHGPKPDALAYRVRQTDDGQPRIEWEPDTVQADADDVLSKKRGHQSGAIDHATEWLLDALKAGPILSRDLDGMAEAVGVRPGTLQRAREKLREGGRIVAEQLRSDNKVQGWAIKLTPKET